MHADANSPFQAGDHSSETTPAAPFPCTSGARTCEKSISLVGWSLNVGRMSGVAGTSPGRTSATLASLHLRTDCWTALTMAAGESVPNHHDSPLSSTASVVEGIVHPILRKDATIAATGPAAICQHESSLEAILRLASAKAVLSCSGVNQ